MRVSFGACGSGNDRGMAPRSLKVATCVQPRSATPAEVTTTATTSPSAPSLVRSRRRISTIVAIPTASVCRSIWLGLRSVLNVRATRFAPGAA